MDAPPLHIAMYPWFAMGHLNPFLYLSNRLAERGHRISFFIPTRTQAKLEHLNLYPHLITFVPINIPHVDGLPLGAETTLDVPPSLGPLLRTAMDLTEKEIERLLLQLKPKIVLFDSAYWLPDLARRLGIKSVQYFIFSLTASAFLESTEMQETPYGFPDSSIKLHVHEERALTRHKELKCGSGIRLFDRIKTVIRSSDAVGFRGCREIEGPYADYLETLYGKPILLSGPLIPEVPNSILEPKWAHWLGGHENGSVIYCAFGSECRLQQNQFEELVLGLELCGFPFLAALKPPIGFESVETALPEGFEERVKGRGVVYGGWIQQQLIMEHPSLGCFITHCGPASMLEALVSQCQLVLLPNIFDQIINARMISKSFKAGVEVERGEEDGLFTKESLCKAVRIVMDEESDVGREVKSNHAKLRTLLLSNNLDSIYIDSFCHKLQDLLK